MDQLFLMWGVGLGGEEEEVNEQNKTCDTDLKRSDDFGRDMETWGSRRGGDGERIPLL